MVGLAPHARMALWALLHVAAAVLPGTAFAAGNELPPLELPPPPVVGAAAAGVAPADAAGPPSVPVVRGQSAVSAPERIARLQRTIEADRARLVDLKCLVNDPVSDSATAERKFRELDTQVAEQKKLVQEAAESGDPTALERARNELAEVERKWLRARNQFQLALDERKAQQASIATLVEKIAKDEAALGKLRGDEPSRPAADSAPSGVADPPPAPATAPLPTRVEAAPALPSLLPPQLNAAAAAAQPKTQSEAQEEEAAAPPEDSATPPAASSPPIEATNTSKNGKNGKKKSDERLEAATKAAAESHQEAVRAEGEALQVTERLDVLRRDIALQHELLTVAKSKFRAAEQQRAELNAELERKAAAEEDVTQVRGQIREADRAKTAAEQESVEILERLDALQTELGSLQDEELAALREAHAARSEAELAEKLVATLKNPLAWENVRHWLLENGLAILLIVAIITIILWAGHMLEQRIVLLIAGRSPRGGRNERENRARTLVSVMHNVVRIVAVGVGAIMILDQVGLPVGPLVGGAAVVGLAVAFGAQSLIKDYFTGFMVLLEQQYMIDDVVKIGDIAGQVERITLRMTVLRDIEGRVHFIPHGQINTVTNLTHGWSRALFDIGVAYKENIDQVIEVLMELARELKRDSTFGLMILEDPVMMGVEAFGDSAVIVRFFIKTRPLRQWEIKRELLRRIKNRFDELNIEIPFPHRTVYFGNAPANGAVEGLSAGAGQPSS